MEELKIKSIAAGSVYKLVFVGSWIGSIPIFLFLGVLAMSGFEIVSWNENYITGLGGLVGSPLVGLFMATIFGALLGTIMAIGLRIFSKFRSIRIFCEIE